MGALCGTFSSLERRRTMILSVGEILLDVYAEERTHVLGMQGRIGGAPFNVAANIARNGGRVSFYGAVGKDGIGSFLEKEAEAYSFQKLLLDKREEPTTLALVSLNDGERNFSFLRGADFHLSSDKLDDFSLNAKDIIHIGSLMLSKEEGGLFFYKAFNLAKKKGFYISFDMNLRSNLFESQKEARHVYETIYPCVDFLKASEEDLNYLGMSPEELKSHYMKEKSVLFVTRSSNGSEVYVGEEHYSVSSKKIDVVDSTGAGDAFFARILLEIDLCPDPFSLSSERWKEILIKANEDGAEACLHRGALE